MKKEKLSKKVKNHILNLNEMVNLPTSSYAKDAYHYSIGELNAILRQHKLKKSKPKPPKFPEPRVVCIPGFFGCCFCKDKVCK